MRKKTRLDVTYPAWLDITVLRSYEVLKVKNNKNSTSKIYPHNIGKGGIRDIHPNNTGSCHLFLLVSHQKLMIRAHC